MNDAIQQFAANLQLSENEFALMDMEAGIEHFGREAMEAGIEHSECGQRR